MRRLFLFLLLAALVTATCERWAYEAADDGIIRTVKVHAFNTTYSDWSDAVLYVDGVQIGYLGTIPLHVNLSCNRETTFEARDVNRSISIVVKNKCAIVRCGEESFLRRDNVTSVDFFLKEGAAGVYGERYSDVAESDMSLAPPAQDQGFFAGNGSAEPSDMAEYNQNIEAIWQADVAEERTRFADALTALTPSRMYRMSPDDLAWYQAAAEAQGETITWLASMETLRAHALELQPNLSTTPTSAAIQTQAVPIQRSLLEQIVDAIIGFIFGR